MPESYLASLIPSPDVAIYDCLLQRFFSKLSNSSDKRIKLKRKVTFQLVSMFKFSSFNCSGWKDLCCNCISMYMSFNQLSSILATLATEILNLSTTWFLRCEDFNEDGRELKYLCALQKLIQTSIKFYI